MIADWEGVVWRPLLSLYTCSTEEEANRREISPEEERRLIIGSGWLEQATMYMTMDMGP